MDNQHTPVWSNWLGGYYIKADNGTWTVRRVAGDVEFSRWATLALAKAAQTRYAFNERKHFEKDRARRGESGGEPPTT